MTHKIAEKILKMEKDKLMSEPEFNRDWDLITALDIAIEVLEERLQGKWQLLSLKTLDGDDIIAYECPCCRVVADKKYKHCPKCGTKMEEAENESSI